MGRAAGAMGLGNILGPTQTSKYQQAAVSGCVHTRRHTLHTCTHASIECMQIDAYMLRYAHKCTHMPEFFGNFLLCISCIHASVLYGNMYDCVHVCMYAWLYACMCVCVCVCVHICVMFACMHAYIHAVCNAIHECMDIHMYLCMHECMFVMYAL